MILSPKEAATKKCPLMSRQFASRDGTPIVQHCLGDCCMKWRWAPGRSPEEFEAKKAWHTDPPPPAGYCGA